MLLSLEQPCICQDLEVVAHGWLAHAERFSQIARTRLGARSNKAEKTQSRRICEGLQPRRHHVGVNFRQRCTTHGFTAGVHAAILCNLSTLVYVAESTDSIVGHARRIQSATDVQQLDVANPRGMSIQ